MRLVTRSDFDGLACAVLLKKLGLITDYKFAHPKDLQDGIVAVSADDILANVPYVAGCGMWFDHHSSEKERLGDFDYQGCSRAAPSCARVIWDYYGGHDVFPRELDPMLDAVDKVDSGSLSLEEISKPSGWVLLGLIMDPRIGLGRYHDYHIGNYQLMLDMIDYCASMSAEDILSMPDVAERVQRYFTQQEAYQTMLGRCARVHGNVLVVDLRNEPEIFSGNRFTMYSMYPACNVSMQIIWGKERRNVVITVGHSILNRTCSADIGSLMLAYDGGGHPRVGTCQVPLEEADAVIEELTNALSDQ